MKGKKKGREGEQKVIGTNEVEDREEKGVLLKVRGEGCGCTNGQVMGAGMGKGRGGERDDSR